MTFSQRSQGISWRLLTLASFLVAHRLGMISLEAFYAVVAMPAGCIVLTSQTNAAASFARQFVEARIKFTLP